MSGSSVVEVCGRSMALVNIVVLCLVYDIIYSYEGVPEFKICFIEGQMLSWLKNYMT